MDRRALTSAEAAAYVGAASPAAFLREVRQGVWPQAMNTGNGRNRWDRRALDAAMDKASGLVDPIEEAIAILDRGLGIGEGGPAEARHR